MTPAPTQHHQPPPPASANHSVFHSDDPVRCLAPVRKSARCQTIPRAQTLTRAVGSFLLLVFLQTCKWFLVGYNNAVGINPPGSPLPDVAEEYKHCLTHSSNASLPPAATPPPPAAVTGSPTHSAPADSTPTESTPTESTGFTPTEFTPTEFTPTEFTPTEFTPTEFTPTEFTPTEFTPTEFTPTEAQASDDDATPATNQDHQPSPPSATHQDIHSDDPVRHPAFARVDLPVQRSPLP